MSLHDLFLCASGRTRTPDLAVRSRTLYPSELRTQLSESGKDGIRTHERGLPVIRLAGGPNRPLWHLPKIELIMISVKAEEEGFEPPLACTSTVFKTVAFVHSAIPPKTNFVLFLRKKRVPLPTEIASK